MVEKWPRRIMTLGSVFYVEIFNPGQNSTGVTFSVMVWLGFLQEKNDPPYRRILTRGSHFYVEKWPRVQYSTGVTSLHYTGQVTTGIRKAHLILLLRWAKGKKKEDKEGEKRKKRRGKERKKELRKKIHKSVQPCLQLLPRFILGSIFLYC
jgi:hypothetical protein